MVGYRGKEIAQRFELPGTGLGLVIPARLAFINLQTTGANPVRDRITRIGVLEAEGDRVSTWSTLVNPQRPIPALIQRLSRANSSVWGSPSGPTCCVRCACLASSFLNISNTTWTVSWSVMI